jgi:hypothetical protein
VTTNRPKQIGEREEVIDGQKVKIRIFAPVLPDEPDALPVLVRRDNSRTAGQRFIRATRERLV